MSTEPRFELVRFSSAPWEVEGHTLAKCSTMEDAEAIATAALSEWWGWVDVYDNEAPWDGEPLKTWGRYSSPKGDRASIEK